MTGNRRLAIESLAKKALLLAVIWGVAAMFMALFWVKKGDIAAARDEALRGKSPPSENAAANLPTITRRNFEFKFPVPGERGKYHWKVGGQRSVSVSATTDRITDFRGEMEEAAGVFRLSSPTALFDKENRVLTASEHVVLKSEWVTTKAAEMTMDMKTNVTEFSGGVTTEIDREEAEKREALPTATAPPGETSGPAKPPPDKPKEEKKKKSPLVITSEKLSVELKRNRAIYRGKVVARDESGTIYADTMEAYYYSDEEKKKNPKRKGIKTVTCLGDVIMDQTAGKKQARCVRAVYDAETNILHLYGDPKAGKKVVYRDEEAKNQVKALELIFDRNKDEITFEREVEAISFDPDRESFLGFMGEERPKPEERKGEPDSGKMRKAAPKEPSI